MPRSIVATRLAAFILERHPFALPSVQAALAVIGPDLAESESTIDALRPKLARELEARLKALHLPAGVGETTPGMAAGGRFDAAVTEVVRACDGFLRRAAIQASLTREERLEILRGMLLTRATDNRLKT